MAAGGKGSYVEVLRPRKTVGGLESGGIGQVSHQMERDMLRNYKRKEFIEDSLFGKGLLMKRFLDEHGWAIKTSDVKTSRYNLVITKGFFLEVFYLFKPFHVNKHKPRLCVPIMHRVF